jgi:hypothetical protein
MNMSATTKDELLQRLQREVRGDGAAWSDIAAQAPKHDRAASGHKDDPRLAALLDRINALTETEAQAAAPPVSPAPQASSPQEKHPTRPRPARPGHPVPLVPPAPEIHDAFVPIEPESIFASGFTDSEVEALALKYLNARAEASGRDIADQIKLPFRLVDPLLQSMKTDRLVAHKGAAMMNGPPNRSRSSSRPRTTSGGRSPTC